MKKIINFFKLLRKGKFDLIAYKIKKKIGIKDLLPPMPNWLVVEPANICNCKCLACPTGSGKMNRAPRLMKFEEFKGIIDQVEDYVDKIVLFNYGEPFLNKDLIKMIEYAAQAGMNVKVSTNGAFLKGEEFIEKLVKSGLKNLIVCLDGINQETVAKYRIGVNFQDVIEGFKLLSETKKKYKNVFPKVELQFIIMKHNESQIEEMRKLSKELNVDVYSEKTVGIDWRDKDAKKLAEELLPLNEDLSRYTKNESGQIILKGKMENSCEVINNSLVVNSNGEIVPCCFDSSSEFVMGNAFSESIKDVWRNEKYQNLRRTISKNRKSIPMCNICSMSMFEDKVKKYEVK